MSGRAYLPIVLTLAGLFAASLLAPGAAADHHEGRAVANEKTGCVRQEDGGYICRYELPPGYNIKAAADEQRMEVFEGCLKALYGSCRELGGGRNCGWTAQISCRALSKPRDVD